MGCCFIRAAAVPGTIAWAPAAAAAKKWGASSASQSWLMCVNSRMYKREVNTSSLKSTHLQVCQQWRVAKMAVNARNAQLDTTCHNEARAISPPQVAARAISSVAYWDFFEKRTEDGWMATVGLDTSVT